MMMRRIRSSKKTTLSANVPLDTYCAEVHDLGDEKGECDGYKQKPQTDVNDVFCPTKPQSDPFFQAVGVSLLAH